MTFGLGYNSPRLIKDSYFYFTYPFLLPVPGYNVRAVGLPDAERDRNLEMLCFIIEQATSRGLHFQLALWTHAYDFICPKCGRIVWAKLPAGFIEGQLFGLRLQALIGYMKGSLHASYSALEDFCREVLNIDVARSHLCNTIYRDSDALTGSYEELKQHIPTELVLNIDESGWKDKGIKYWIWIFCTSAISFFYIAKSRSSQVLKDVLGETYNGTMVTSSVLNYLLTGRC